MGVVVLQLIEALSLLLLKIIDLAPALVADDHGMISVDTETLA